jgi:hypothetical protein
MMKAIFSLLLSFFAVAVTVFVTADHPHVSPTPSSLSPFPSPSAAEEEVYPFLRIGPLLQQFNPLKLSNSQKEAIEDLIDAHRYRTKPCLKRIETGKEELLASVRREMFHEEEARSVAAGLARELAWLTAERECLDGQIRAGLSAKQQALADRLLGELDEFLEAGAVNRGAEGTRLELSTFEGRSLNGAERYRIESIFKSLPTP